MRCDEMRALLDLYIDRELPEELKSRLERHLLRCPVCSFELQGLNQTRSLLRESVQRAEAAPGFRERALARLHEKMADRLKPAPSAFPSRQWKLPLLEEEAG